MPSWRRDDEPDDVPPGSGPVLPGAEGMDPVAAERLRESEGVFTSDLTPAAYAMLVGLDFAPLGLVMGISIYHTGLQGYSSRQNLELTVLTQAMYSARELAMGRMEAEAQALGADGIVGVALTWTYPGWGEGNVVEFQALGTAVRGPAGQPSHRRPDGRAFSCDMSVAQFAQLLGAGVTPVSFVLGTCVYHLAVQGGWAALKQMGRNQEMTVQTQGLYEAREAAMTRMQAEAKRDGASGIVAGRIRQLQHGWGSHVMEFYAEGTAIRPYGSGAKVTPSPVFVFG